ncbi:hypothetical protein [Hyphomonas sp.]|uniref:hypothetical protein n=1 Tax=Hyphomonas sp. TaxID=87 RepID=UPI0025BD54C4|nr:hypothetical protein [Hyphomonas sp.]
MLTTVVSTGVVAVIYGEVDPATRMQENAAESLRAASAERTEMLRTFALLDSDNPTATLRCHHGFQAPNGGLFCGPVTD